MLKSVKPLKVIQILVVLLIIASIVISLYLFFYRKVGITKDYVSFERLLLEDVSNVQAEKMNYDKVESKYADYTLSELSYFKYSQTTAASNIFTKLINWKDSKLVYDSALLENNIPVVYSEAFETFNVDSFYNELSEIISANNLKFIILDSSLQSNLEDYYNLVTKLSELQDLNLSLLLLPRTAELENYSNYKELNKNITKIVDINRIAAHADYFFIETYDYTPDKAALPGPNTDLSEVEDSVQYYIYKGLPREKIFIGVNQVNFMWEDRYFESDMKNNMLVTATQATVFEGDKSKITDVILLESGESYGFFQDLVSEKTKNYLVVLATDTLTLNIKYIASKYNLQGIFYRY